MKTLFLIFSLFLSNSENRTKSNFSNHLIQVDTSKYAILKPDSIPRYIFDKSCKPADLSNEDIKKIDVLINNVVEKKSGNFHIKPSKYYKQLIAIINSKGEKEVWVNCICSLQNHANWRKSIVFVLDGGPCYFNLKINLTKNTLYDFGVNGVG